MPSPLVHATAGYILYRVFRRQDNEDVTRPDVPLLATTFFFSVLPDIDVALGFWHRDMGNFHNQESHSLFVGLFVALLFGGLLAIRNHRKALPLFAVALVAYSVHIVLDSLIPSRGVMMFWPLTAERFASPIPLFVGLKWSEGLWHPFHIVTFANELLVAALGVFLAHAYARTRRTAPFRNGPAHERRLSASE